MLRAKWAPMSIHTKTQASDIQLRVDMKLHFEGGSGKITHFDDETVEFRYDTVPEGAETPVVNTTVKEFHRRYTTWA